MVFIFVLSGVPPMRIHAPIKFEDFPVWFPRVLVLAVLQFAKQRREPISQPSVILYTSMSNQRHEKAEGQRTPSEQYPENSSLTPAILARPPPNGYWTVSEGIACRTGTHARCTIICTNCKVWF